MPYGVWFPELGTFLGIRVWAKTAHAARRILSRHICTWLNECGKDIKESYEQTILAIQRA